MHAEPIIHMLSAYTANKQNLSPCRCTEISAWGSVISELLLPSILASTAGMLDRSVWELGGNQGSFCEIEERKY